MDEITTSSPAFAKPHVSRSCWVLSENLSKNKFGGYVNYTYLYRK